MLLCSHWRYRCNLWRPRGNRPSRAAPLPAAPSELCWELQGAPTPDALWLHIAARLRPMSLESCQLVLGPAARAAAAADPATARLYAREADWISAALHSVTTDALPTMTAMVAGVRAFESELSPATAALPAARVALPACLSVLDALCRAFGGSSESAIRAYALQLASPATPPPLQTWLQELHRSKTLSHGLLMRVAALVAQCRTGTVETFVRAVSMLADFVMTHACAAVGALQARQAWIEAAASAAGALGGSSSEDSSFETSELCGSGVREGAAIGSCSLAYCCVSATAVRAVARA